MDDRDRSPIRMCHCPARNVPMRCWYDGMYVYAVLVIPEQEAELPPQKVKPVAWATIARDRVAGWVMRARRYLAAAPDQSPSEPPRKT